MLLCCKMCYFFLLCLILHFSIYLPEFVLQVLSNKLPTFYAEHVSWLYAAATHADRTFTLVAANDVLLDSSAFKYSPSDCQKPEVLNKNLVEGNILLCGYSFNFVVGTASIKKVSETAKSLGAIGFVLAVENSSPGTKYDPVPVGLPGILIADVSKSMVNIVILLSWFYRT